MEIDYKKLQEGVTTIKYWYNREKKLIVISCNNSTHLRETSTLSKQYLNKARIIISFEPTQADKEEFGTTRIKVVAYNNLEKLIEDEIACECPQWRIDAIKEAFKDLPLGGVKEGTIPSKIDEEENFTPVEMLKIKTLKLF